SERYSDAKYSLGMAAMNISASEPRIVSTTMSPSVISDTMTSRAMAGMIFGYSFILLGPFHSDPARDDLVGQVSGASKEKQLRAITVPAGVPRRSALAAAPLLPRARRAPPQRRRTPRPRGRAGEFRRPDRPREARRRPARRRLRPPPAPPPRPTAPRGTAARARRAGD